MSDHTVSTAMFAAGVAQIAVASIGFVGVLGFVDVSAEYLAVALAAVWIGTAVIATGAYFVGAGWSADLDLDLEEFEELEEPRHE